MTDKIKYSKANGTGNNFIIIVDHDASFDFSKSFIQKICNYKSTNRYDGFIAVSFKNQIYHLDYYNCDGEWESLCINGSRCVAAILNKKKLVKNEFVLSAGDGNHSVLVKNINNISVSINPPLFVKKNIEVCGYVGSFVNSGAKHFVIKSNNLNQKNILNIGKEIRYSVEHFPLGVNVSFYRVVDKNTLEIVTYEKGVEDVVLSCASGSAACCFDAWHKGLIQNPCKINVPGGRLLCGFDLEWQNAWIAGPVEIEAMDLEY